MSEISKQTFLKSFGAALQRGEAALFIGAGISVGAGFVDWRDLLREVAQDLELDVDEEHDLIALAQYEYNRNKNRHRLNQKIIHEFQDRAAQSTSHEWIARLPVDTIWTTNYDRLIETALDRLAKSVDVKHTQAQLLHRVPHTDVTLLKMHGDVDHPDEAVLIKDDYERYESKRGLFVERLRGDLATRHFLFLGFSFTDPNLDYVFSRLRTMLGDKAENQPPRYCILKRPTTPTGKYGGKQNAEYETEKRRLPHRVADLARFNIDVVMVDDYREIPELLEKLARSVAAKSVLISGSAHDYAPVGQAKTESFCHLLGSEIIRRGYTLVSGFGLGIAGSCILGAFEQARRQRLGRLGERLRLHPFPQVVGKPNERAQLYSDIRSELMREAGVTIFIAGNKLDAAKDEVVLADGVMDEFALAKDHGHFLIPVPCTGGAAAEVWKQIEPRLSEFFPGVNVTAEFEVLSDLGRNEREWVAAIFAILEKVTKP